MSGYGAPSGVPPSSKTYPAYHAKDDPSVHSVRQNCSARFLPRGHRQPQTPSPQTSLQFRAPPASRDVNVLVILYLYWNRSSPYHTRKSAFLQNQILWQCFLFYVVPKALTIEQYGLIFLSASFNFLSSGFASTSTKKQ